MFSTCHILTYSSIIICIVGLAVGIYIAYKGISSLYSISNDMTINFKFMFLSSILSYMACLIFSTVSSFFLCANNATFHVLLRCAIFSYYCILIPILLLTFIARLQFTFDETIYKIKRNIFVFFYVLVIFIALCNVTYVVISTDFYVFSNNYRLYVLGIYIFAIGLTVYFTLAIILVSIFISKLSQLLINRKQSISSKRRNAFEDIIENVEMPETQSAFLISFVSKYLILSVFSFSTTFIVIVGLALSQYLLQDSFIATVIFRSFGLLDIVCNFVCLYLQFVFAANDYYFVCMCCDRMCRRLLVHKAIQKMVIDVKNHPVLDLAICVNSSTPITAH